MTAQYLIIAILLAMTLNHANRFVRAAGTALAALSLSFIVLSIGLADIDGTFAVLPADNYRPALLNLLGAIALAAILFLLWAAVRQCRRRSTEAVTWHNSSASYGLVSRSAHWMTATLIFCLIPMGLFLQTLPEGSPARAIFLAVHETLGVTVLALVLVRLAWLFSSKLPSPSASLQPWERSLARIVHILLYGLLLLLPGTGLLLIAAEHVPLDLYGWSVHLPVTADTAGAPPWPMLHNYVLPALFCAVIALHLAAALKHHFWAGRPQDVRRMLR